MDKEQALAIAVTLASQSLFEIAATLSGSEDESSDEDEIKILLLSQKRKLMTPTRIEGYTERNVPGFTMQQFQQHFRVKIEAYEYLLNVLGPQLKRQAEVGRPTVDVERQILAVIWILATPDLYR